MGRWSVKFLRGIKDTVNMHPSSLTLSTKGGRVVKKGKNFVYVVIERPLTALLPCVLENSSNSVVKAQ